MEWKGFQLPTMTSMIRPSDCFRYRPNPNLCCRSCHLDFINELYAPWGWLASYEIRTPCKRTEGSQNSPYRQLISSYLSRSNLICLWPVGTSSAKVHDVCNITYRPQLSQVHTTECEVSTKNMWSIQIHKMLTAEGNRLRERKPEWNWVAIILWRI